MMAVGIIKKRVESKMYLLVLLVSCLFLLLASLIKAAPPTPHNVEGHVYNNNSGNGAGGLPVRINNTINGDVILTYTQSQPPFAPFLGRYLTTINGNDGDVINITSWNATHYGWNRSTLASTTTSTDILLNTTRSSEANVTILNPLNDTLKNKSIDFNLTANVTMLGNDATDCNATINFSDNSVLNLSSWENSTHVLGNIPFETSKKINWSLKGINEGSSNITLSVKCGSDDINLENLESYTAYNITMQNLAPVVSNLTLNALIDLSPGDNMTVECNASIDDGNTISDIRVVNATFYHSSISLYSNNDYNNHYTNSSCINVSSNLFQSNYSCGFEVAYFADSGIWQCNITAADNSNITAFDNISAFVNELLAIDLSPAGINYGNLEVPNISDEVNITIKNFGNVPFNTTVRAHAPNESLAYLNLSMSCLNGNISNANQRYSKFNGTNFADMAKTNNETQLIHNFTLPQRTSDLAFGNDTNTTFWRLQAPSGISGVCNGTVIFSAVRVY